MQGDEIKIKTTGDQIVLEIPQVIQRQKPERIIQEDQFYRRLEVVREWKNDTVFSMDNQFVKFEQQKHVQMRSEVVMRKQDR